MTPRQHVLAKFSTATLVKSNIASWGVFVPHANQWLSYGAARPHLAWRTAATAVAALRGTGASNG